VVILVRIHLDPDLKHCFVVLSLVDMAQVGSEEEEEVPRSLALRIVQSDDEDKRRHRPGWLAHQVALWCPL